MTGIVVARVRGMSTRQIDHDGLDLARYARITARLRCVPGGRWKVLAAEGLGPAQWDAARKAWARAIEEEIARGGDELLIGFAEALAAARAANDAAPIAAAPPPEPEPVRL